MVPLDQVQEGDVESHHAEHGFTGRKRAGGICKSCQGKPDPELAVKGSKGANIAAGIEAAIEKGEAA